MKRYDIVFMGHLATAEIFPFKGDSFVEWGGPAFFGPLAASCLGKKIAAVTRIANSETQLLEPLKAAGVDLYIQPLKTVQWRIVFPTEKVDERLAFHVSGGGHFNIDDLPPIEPCLIHLGGLSVHEFSLEFVRELKDRGFRLSVDMCSFVNNVDEETQLGYLADVPKKKEILSMVDFVKADIMEAKALTGTDILNDQANMLEEWGSPETVITCSDGALARCKKKTIFARFTHRSSRGRMGRGDTFSGAYLARRLDHPVEDSLRFAVALTSIKMESVGPFSGSLEDVIERMADTVP